MKKLILVLLISILIFFKNIDQLKIWLLNLLTVKRGILSINCKWLKISDYLLKDSTGINLFYKYKKKNNNFSKVYMFHYPVYVVTNIKFIKLILDNSPNIFSAGKVKLNFFKSFMAKNVGVSKGCPWKNRRKINEYALYTNKLHEYSSKINEDIRQIMTNKFLNLKEIKVFNDFKNFSKLITTKIIFNEDKVSDSIFEIFSEANSINAILFPNNFKIKKSIYNEYIKTLNFYIENPKPNSLIYLCTKISKDKIEILHQIPHFIFPIFGPLFTSIIPRLLLFLGNHNIECDKVIKEINRIPKDEKNVNIYINNLNFLRKCILETLRLNNPVTTTFRTLEKDFKFKDDKIYNFKKGDSFLILNNPILRNKSYFKEPDKFIPSRWTKKMEKSYYALSFNQGPQICPGKNLVIFLAQSFIYNLFRIKKITSYKDLVTKKINTKNISQMINTCDLKFKFK